MGWLSFLQTAKRCYNYISPIMNVRHKGFPVFSILLFADVFPVTREYVKNHVINHVFVFPVKRRLL